MSHRSLVLVSGLTLGDYLLWNWSLGANHDLLALVCGLLLPALSVAFIWLLVLNIARLLARSGRRSRLRSAARRRHAAQGDPIARRERAISGKHAPPAGAGGRGPQDDEAVRDSPASSPGKLAA